LGTVTILFCTFRHWKTRRNSSKLVETRRNSSKLGSNTAKTNTAASMCEGHKQHTCYVCIFFSYALFMGMYTNMLLSPHWLPAQYNLLLALLALRPQLGHDIPPCFPADEGLDSYHEPVHDSVT